MGFLGQDVAAGYGLGQILGLQGANAVNNFHCAQDVRLSGLDDGHRAAHIRGTVAQLPPLGARYQCLGPGLADQQAAGRQGLAGGRGMRLVGRGSHTLQCILPAPEGQPRWAQRIADCGVARRFWTWAVPTSIDVTMGRTMALRQLLDGDLESATRFTAAPQTLRRKPGTRTRKQAGGRKMVTWRAGGLSGSPVETRLRSHPIWRQAWTPPPPRSPPRLPLHPSWTTSPCPSPWWSSSRNAPACP